MGSIIMTLETAMLLLIFLFSNVEYMFGLPSNPSIRGPNDDGDHTMMVSREALDEGDYILLTNLRPVSWSRDHSPDHPDDDDHLRVRRNAVLAAKLENEDDNIISYVLILVCTVLLLSYGIMVTYKNWKSNKDVILI